VIFIAVLVIIVILKSINVKMARENRDLWSLRRATCASESTESSAKGTVCAT
jgi:hypothetical protein